jgi:hypothetical protein
MEAEWTGLNLRDERAVDASDDKILTDLVNRIATHMARVERLGFDQELLNNAVALPLTVGIEMGLYSGERSHLEKVVQAEPW